MSTAPIHKVLSQRSEQKRSISTAEQKISISSLNAKRCYLGAQCKKYLSRQCKKVLSQRSVQEGSISALNLKRSSRLLKKIYTQVSGGYEILYVRKGITQTSDKKYDYLNNFNPKLPGDTSFTRAGE